MKSAYSFARARRLRQRSDPRTAGEHGALRQRSRGSGVKERGFPKGENSRGGQPLVVSTFGLPHQEAQSKVISKRIHLEI